MDDHLTTERISALIEQPGRHSEAADHLEVCSRCAAEYETMLRMRMTLSALGDCDPPADEWTRIAACLEEGGLLREQAAAGPGAGRRGGADRPVAGALLASASSWPVRAAAALVLFAGGIAAGLQIGSDGGGLAEAGAARSGDAARSVDPAGVEESVAQKIRSYLVSAGGPEADPVGNPVAAAEELATLDALAQAVREALEQEPADPTLNDLLFRLTERREELTSGFGQAAHLVTLDYR